jgi:hypothetical protein
MSLAKPLSFLATAATFCAVAFASPQAQAGIEACGNIDLSAGVQCEFVAEGGCEAMCTPLSVQAACAGRGALDCRGGCSGSASVDCTSSCQVDCMAACDVDPGSFECSGACKADCSGSCSGECSARCAADADQAGCEAQCEASCEATCSTECDAECDVVPAEADCMAQCDGCCGGSCTAEANLTCQLDCQADLQVECEADLQGGCEVQCSQPQGALFCNGNYVAYDDVEACLLALAEELNIEVSGSASCEDGSCQAEGSISCFTTIDSERPFSGLLAMFMGMGLLAGVRRRRKDDQLVA